MKKANRKLIPAVAMLLVSTIMLSTASFAWFSMNEVVTATGMQVKAKAEGGIVISNSAKTAWNASADAAYTQVAELLPTSTKDAKDWYHAKSTDADDAMGAQDKGNYEKLASIALSDALKSEGVGYVNVSSPGFQAGTDEAYYLKSTYYIRSSGEQISGGSIYVNDMTVATPAHLIDASLRVAIVVDGKPFVYAPVTTVSQAEPIGESTPTFTYKVGGNDQAFFSARNPKEAVAGGGGDTATTHYDAGKNVKIFTGNIPATAESAKQIDVYVFFEGEDANCKSNNISGIELTNLTVTVKFGTKEAA